MEASVSSGTGQGAAAGAVQPGISNGTTNNGTGAIPGQGAPQGQPTAQPGQQQGDFNWGPFPNIPEAQREMLGPHLREIQGYVTRMEQQHAPYNGLREAVPADQVENLVGFLNAYSANPVGTILGLLQQERDSGAITYEQLMEFVGAAPQEQQQQVQPGQGQPEQMPDWARQMQARLEQYDQQAEQQQLAQQEAEQQAALDQAKINIRAQLTQGGIPENVVSDEAIVAAIIATNGDEQAAANMFSSIRDGLLGAFTNDKTAGNRAPAVNGQLPETPQGPKRRGDGFDEARTGAKQFLAQQAAMTARG
jgi:hypothetical protein